MTIINILIKHYKIDKKFGNSLSMFLSLHHQLLRKLNERIKIIRLEIVGLEIMRFLESLNPQYHNHQNVR